MSYIKNANGDIEITDINNYYPFGMNHLQNMKQEMFNNFNPSATPYNYKYQGQELQETGFYSFKWRNYISDVGRFFNIDPLAEKYTYNSTYAFQENKMGLGRELEGLELLQERGVITATGMTAKDICHNGPLPSYMSYLNYKSGYSASQGMDVPDLPSGALGMGKWNDEDGSFKSFAGEAKATKALGVFELIKLVNTAIDAPGEIKAMGKSAKANDYVDKLAFQLDAMQTAQEVVNNANLKLDNKTKIEITNYVFDGRLPEDVNSRSNSVVNLGSKTNIVNTANSVMRQNDITVRKGPEADRRQELEQQRMDQQNKLQNIGR